MVYVGILRMGMALLPRKEPEQPATPASARLPFMRYFVSWQEI